jgi:alanine racemase
MTGRPTWVEVDLEAFDRNVAAVASLMPEPMRMIAMLKADGYGHGAVELARRCGVERVAMIGVALLEEALELRRAEITLPILLLGPVDLPQIEIALAHDVTVAVPGPEELELVAGVARERDLAIHLKLDSGMGRMGVVETELGRVVEMLRSAPRLRVEAIYTHLANAEDLGDPFTDQQIERFDAMVEALRQAGITAPRHHIANSAALLRSVRPGDYVRAGLTLLGVPPMETNAPPLDPVLRWRTEIVRLKELPAGSAVGYGTTFHTTRPSLIATLPVGYADGYNRALSNRADVLVRGRRAPVVGRVSMDLVTIDVTDVPEVVMGDEVILIGAQGGDRIAVQELARKLDTIPYEVFCNISARIPRVPIDSEVTSISEKRRQIHSRLDL